MGHRQLNEPEGGIEVAGHLLLVFFQRDLRPRAADLQGCIQHQRVQRANLGHKSFSGAGVGQIARHNGGFSALFFDQISGFFGFCPVGRAVNDHLIAVLRQPQRQRPPNSSGGAGHQYAPCFDFAHILPFPPYSADWVSVGSPLRARSYSFDQSMSR